MGKGFLNEGVFSRKYLQGRMQVLARTDARTCGDGCTYLQGRMHVLARADASTCGDGCTYVRLRWAKLSPKSSVLFWIRERGGKTHSIRVTIALRKFLPNRFMTKMRERVRERKKQGIEPTETRSPLYNVKSLFKKLHSSNIHAHALFSCKTYASRISRFRFRAPSRPITP